MPESGEAVKEALVMGAESADQVDAAKAELDQGRSGISVGLLLEALEKERKSIELFDEGIETLKQALDDRRHALDQQEELLNQLVSELGEQQE